MKFKVIINMIAMSSVLLTQGCATVLNGTTQNIGISSQPTGANVTIDNVAYGVTPLFANLKRGSEHIVTIEMPGYEKSQLTLTKSVSGWVWGNVIIGGLIGLAIDAYSGGLYKLSPEQLDAALNESQNGHASVYKKDGVYVVAVLKADPSWQKIGTLNQI